MKRILFFILISINSFAQPANGLVAKFNFNYSNGIPVDGTYWSSFPENGEQRIGTRGIARKNVFSIPFTGNEYLNFDYTKPWSISFWMNTTATSQDNIVAHFNSALGKGFKIKQISAYSLQVILAASPTAQTTKTFGNVGVHAYTLNGKWVHVCITYDGSGLSTGFKAYLQGSAMGAGTPGTDNLNGGDITNTSNFNFGTTLSYMFDFRLYDTVKTISEVRTIADCKIDSVGLILNHRLDEMGGTIIYNCYKPQAMINAYGQGVGNAITSATVLGAYHNIYSFMNERGYGVTTGSFVPRNEASTAGVDAKGNTLITDKPVKHRAVVTNGVINFNPSNVPLCKLQKDEFPFDLLPVVPTSYTVGDLSKIGNGEYSNPIFVDRSDTVEKNFLIYRSFKNFDEVGPIESYINHKTILYCTIGQSNGLGMGKASELPSQFPTKNINARLWRNGVIPATFNPTNIVPSGNVGPGFITTSLITQNLKEIVYVIENCTGGSSLPKLPNVPFWLPTKGVNNLYTTFKNNFTRALTYLEGTGRKVQVIINFDQGETNHSDPNYGAELKTLITTLRHEIDSLYPGRGYDSIPFICRLISQEQTSNDVTLVRAGLLSCVDSTNINYVTRLYIYDAVIDTLCLYPSPNNVHFTTKGQISNGTQIFNILTDNNLCGETVVAEQRKGIQLNQYIPNEFSIYPNPSEGVTFIYSENPAFVSVTDPSGKLIISFYKAAGECQLLTGEYRPGMYFVKIDNTVHKLLIK